MALSKVFMWSDVQLRIKSLVNIGYYIAKRVHVSITHSLQNNFQINMGNSQSADISEQEAASISKLTGFTKSQIQKIYHRLVVLVQLDVSSWDSQLILKFAPSHEKTIPDWDSQYSALENDVLRFVQLDRESKSFLNRDDLLAIPEFAVNPLAERIVDLFMPVEKESKCNFAEFCFMLAHFQPTNEETPDEMPNSGLGFYQSQFKSGQHPTEQPLDL